jgi:hypothetical protein
MEKTKDTDRIQFELEPLSERAWQRVEARLFERLPDSPARPARAESSGVCWRLELGGPEA